MNAALAGWLISGLLLLASGCACHPQALSTTRYAENMEAMEKWISDSPTFAEFDKQVGLSQRPTSYTSIQFEKFIPAPGIDLVSMRSATRKSPHEVVIHGAAQTKAHEGVRYWIVIDEAVESK